MKWSTAVKLTLMHVLMASFGFFGACGKSSPKKSTGKVVETPAPTTPANTPAATNPTVTEDPLVDSLVAQEDCHKLNKVWIPISPGNGPPACGEAIVSWQCCKAQVMARMATQLPAIVEGLTERFADMEGSNYKLSDCGKVSDTQYKLHWYMANDEANGLYKVTTIDTDGELADSNVSCN